MELRHLRYFVAVADELHFGRAAERLHISQPPLSQQIQNLEEELGLKLFLRRKRGVELTHAGRVFQAEVKQILSKVDRAAEAAKRAERGLIGPFVVACGSLAVSTLLPDILKGFRSRYPEIELSLKEATMQEILDTLQDRSADIGLLTACIDSNALEQHTVTTSRMLAALPEQHPLVGSESIRLKQLAKDPFVLYSRRFAPDFSDDVFRFCRRAGFTPNVVQEAAHHPTLLALVAAGYGVSLVPSLDGAKPPQGVVFVPIRESWAKMELCVAWKKENPSPVVSAFLDVIRNCHQNGNPRPRPRRRRQS